MGRAPSICALLGFLAFAGAQSVTNPSPAAPTFTLASKDATATVAPTAAPSPAPETPLQYLRSDVLFVNETTSNTTDNTTTSNTTDNKTQRLLEVVSAYIRAEIAGWYEIDGKALLDEAIVAYNSTAPTANPLEAYIASLNETLSDVQDVVAGNLDREITVIAPQFDVTALNQLHRDATTELTHQGQQKVDAAQSFFTRFTAFYAQQQQMIDALCEKEPDCVVRLLSPMPQLVEKWVPKLGTMVYRQQLKRNVQNRQKIKEMSSQISEEKKQMNELQTTLDLLNSSPLMKNVSATGGMVQAAEVLQREIARKRENAQKLVEEMHRERIQAAYATDSDALSALGRYPDRSADRIHGFWIGVVNDDEMSYDGEDDYANGRFNGDFDDWSSKPHRHRGPKVDSEPGDENPGSEKPQNKTNAPDQPIYSDEDLRGYTNPFAPAAFGEASQTSGSTNTNPSTSAAPGFASDNTAAHSMNEGEAGKIRPSLDEEGQQQSPTDLSPTLHPFVGPLPESQTGNKPVGQEQRPSDLNSTSPALVDQPPQSQTGNTSAGQEQSLADLSATSRPLVPQLYQNQTEKTPASQLGNSEPASNTTAALLLPPDSTSNTPDKSQSSVLSNVTDAISSAAENVTDRMSSLPLLDNLTSKTADQSGNSTTTLNAAPSNDTKVSPTDTWPANSVTTALPAGQSVGTTTATPVEHPPTSMTADGVPTAMARLLAKLVQEREKLLAQRTIFGRPSSD